MRSLPLVVLRAARRADALGVRRIGLDRVFKALADRHGVRILNRLLLAGGEAVCVGEFEDMLGLKQLTVRPQATARRRHRHAREARLAYSSLEPTAFERIRDVLAVPAAAVAA